MNNRDRNFTDAKIKRRIEQIEQSIERYLAAMDIADRTQSEVAESLPTAVTSRVRRSWSASGPASRLTFPSR